MASRWSSAFVFHFSAPVSASTAYTCACASPKYGAAGAVPAADRRAAWSARPPTPRTPTPDMPVFASSGMTIPLRLPTNAREADHRHLRARRPTRPAQSEGPLQLQLRHVGRVRPAAAAGWKRRVARVRAPAVPAGAGQRRRPHAAGGAIRALRNDVERRSIRSRRTAGDDVGHGAALGRAGDDWRPRRLRAERAERGLRPCSGVSPRSAARVGMRGGLPSRDTPRRSVRRRPLLPAPGRNLRLTPAPSAAAAPVDTTAAAARTRMMQPSSRFDHHRLRRFALEVQRRGRTRRRTPRAEIRSEAFQLAR